MARINLDGWYTVTELAELACTSRHAVLYHLRRHERKGMAYIQRGNRLLITPNAAERFLAGGGIPRGCPRPGYTPLQELAPALGVSPNLLRKQCLTGRVDCYRYRHTIYVHTYQARDANAGGLPPGWVWAREIAAQIGLSRSALVRRLRRRGKPIRRIMHQAAVRRADVNEVMDIAPAGAVPVQRVARLAGVTRNAVTYWCRYHGYPVYYQSRGGGRVAMIASDIAARYLAGRRGRRVDNVA